MEKKKVPATHYINSNVIPVFGIRSEFCCLFYILQLICFTHD